MNKIDISELTYEELIELNKEVVMRIRFLADFNRHQIMTNFTLGEKVGIDFPDQGRQLATILKFNKKTVGIVTESGEEWNVPPEGLVKLQKDEASTGNIVDIASDPRQLQG